MEPQVQDKQKSILVLSRPSTSAATHEVVGLSSILILCNINVLCTRSYIP